MRNLWNFIVAVVVNLDKSGLLYFTETSNFSCQEGHCKAPNTHR